MFPHYSSFRGISKAIVASSHSKFDRGNASGATRDLLCSMRVSQNMGRGTLISALVASASQGVLVSSFSRNWSQLSQVDANRIEKHVNEYFASPNNYAQAIVFERNISVKVLRSEIAKLDEAGFRNVFSASFDEEQAVDPEIVRLASIWKKLSPSQRAKITENSIREIESRTNTYIRIFAKPEKEWVTPEFAKLDDFEELFLELFDPNPAFDIAIRNRTQLRLLRLHAIILKYRFEHDGLPESLAKLDNPGAIHDPITGESFVYESKANLQYELYSRGSATLGRIDMIYKRPIPGEVVDPSTPPN